MTDEAPTAEEIAATAKAAEDVKVAEAKTAADKKAKEEADAKKKTPKDHIIDRMTKREAKLKEELAELEADKKVFNPTSEEPSIQEMFDQRAEKEETISKYIKEYPELETHREKIQLYVNDPSRKGIPVNELIVSAIGMDEFIRIGARLQSESHEDIKIGKMGGGDAGNVKVKTKADARAEKLNQLPSFLIGSKKIYDEQFGNS